MAANLLFRRNTARLLRLVRSQVASFVTERPPPSEPFFTTDPIVTLKDPVPVANMHEDKAFSGLKEYCKKYNLLKDTHSINEILDDDKEWQKFFFPNERSTASTYLWCYWKTLVSFGHSMLSILFKEHLVKHCSHTKIQMDEALKFKEAFSLPSTEMFDTQAKAMLLLRRSTYTLSARKFRSLVFPTPPSMHTWSYKCHDDKIYFRLFNERFFGNDELDLYKSEYSFGNVMLKWGAYRIKGPIHCQCMDAQGSQVPQVMPFLYYYEEDEHGCQVSTIVYKIVGTPLQSLMSTYVHKWFDSRVVKIIWMLVNTIYRLLDENICKVFDERNFFFVDQSAEIKIALVYGQDKSPTDWPVLADWLHTSFHVSCQEDDEFQSFYYALCTHYYDGDYRMHPFLWTVDMKMLFIRNLYYKFSDKSNKYIFDETHCSYQPWHRRMDPLLFKYMLAYQVWGHGSYFRVYYPYKYSDLIALIRNLFEHGRRYPSLITKICGRTIEEQEAYLRFCFPMIFVRFVTRVNELGWVDVIPSF